MFSSLNPSGTSGPVPQHPPFARQRRKARDASPLPQDKAAAPDSTRGEALEDFYRRANKAVGRRLDTQA